jgi:tetratricopeptide (TPR) repeat protein
MPTWRTVRVFISSTFRDMQAERDHLVTVVFPALRERLEPYRIHLIDIDLRWGVTAEQAENGQVLGLCLDQIDDCRPFFLALLGERYGWVPPEVPPDVLRRHPWLEAEQGKSITELEILHGALRDPAGGRRALVCLRAPEATAAIPGPLQSDVFCAGRSEEAAKLAELKRRIRSSGCAVLDGYPCRWDSDEFDRATRQPGRLTGLEEFGTRVRDWLWEAIKGEIDPGAMTEPPAADGDTPDEEADHHERFLEARLRVYAGRQELRQRLLDSARGAVTAPCLVTGPSGSGKSAALADFVSAFRKQQPDALAVAHFVGAGPRSAGLRDLLRRLCLELGRLAGPVDDLPEETDRLRDVFQDLLWKVPPGKRVLLCLDALDQLDEAGQAHELHWLPVQLPPGVKVVASCARDPGESGTVLAAFARRPHHLLEVEPLRDEERRQILHEVPSLSAKALDARQVELLLSNPATRNPLFLLVALEELRGFGSFERLTQRIAALPCDGDTITALFTQVLERLEEEFDPTLVRAVLAALASARRGLSERELQDLVAAAASWDLVPVLRQLRPYLLNRAGLIDFYHRNLLEAVRRRYLADSPARREEHARLAAYFAGRDLDARQVDELPWQLTRAEEWQRLYDLLADLRFFDAAWHAAPLEVKAYWAGVEAHTPQPHKPEAPARGPRGSGRGSGRGSLEDAYRPVLDDPAAHQPDTVSRVATLLADTGHPSAALVLRRHLVGHYRQTGDRARLAVVLGHLASVLKGQGDSDGAMELLREAEQICRELGNRHGIQTTLGNQARILKERGDLEGAMRLLRQAEAICRELGNRYGLQIVLGNQALILHARGDLEGALALLQERERLCRELGNRHGLQIALANQALVLLARGDLEAATALLGESERICRELGNPHGLQIVLGNQARVLEARGDLDGALALLQEQERICRQLGNQLGLQIALTNQGSVLEARGQAEEALALLRTAEQMSRALRNPEGLAIVLRRQAELLARSLNRPGEARAAAEEAHRLAVAHGLTALAEQIDPLLVTLRPR